MLNVRTRGAGPLAQEMERDPAIRRYVERAGLPDFILVTSPSDVELVYSQASRISIARRRRRTASSRHYRSRS